MAPPSLNGNGRYHSPPPPVQASGFHPVEVWIAPKFEEGAESPYPADWRFLFWKNHPMRLRRAFYNRTAEGEEKPDLFDVFSQLVTAHNGWSIVDREGTEHPYPAPTDKRFWDDIDQPLLIGMMRAMAEEMERLPNSPRTSPENSASTSSSATAVEVRPETPSPGPTSVAS